MKKGGRKGERGKRNEKMEKEDSISSGAIQRWEQTIKGQEGDWGVLAFGCGMMSSPQGELIHGHPIDSLV